MDVKMATGGGGGESELTLKDSEQMYKMIVSQLFYDGHQNLAVNLSNVVKISAPCPPSNRLLRVCSLGLKEEEELNDQKEAAAPPNLGTGIDLEFETEAKTISPDAAQYETAYVTAHKGPCRAGAMHPDGSLIATGSDDASIKILDVERMLAKSILPSEAILPSTAQPMSGTDPANQTGENHPVIRTLYDHTGPVVSLAFHPTVQLLVSGSKDFTVRFFNYRKPSVKKAAAAVQEAAQVKTVDFHPTGDWLVVGTKDPTIRLYDTNTQRCFVGPCPRDHHVGPVTSVKWSSNGKMMASGSKDGDLKLWDGVSQRCVNTFKGAHGGAEICSVVFSRNSKYVLSSGKDSVVKLWELSTSRCLIAYTGAGAAGKQDHSTTAVFNHTEDYVFFPDEKTTSLCCWDSRNAERQKLLPLGHLNVVRTIVHSPVNSSFITCSDDNRARFWHRKGTIE